jgi:glyoxylase-like metal-dependent hydrolase (beta-lactamase superfamily II)
MQRERVSEDVYVFTSELYAQVTAGAVVASHGAVLIDTLAFPSETREIANFVERRLGVPVRYVINTHYHADHVLAITVSSRADREPQPVPAVNAKHGPKAFDEARGQSPVAELQLRLPDASSSGADLHLYLGNKTLQLILAQSGRDLVTVWWEDRILFLRTQSCRCRTSWTATWTICCARWTR